MKTAIRRYALLITCAACGTSAPLGKTEPREVEEAGKILACAAALDALSLEAEKNRAALSIPPRHERVVLPLENPDARRALTELELALARAPGSSPLDEAARRFAGSAEALLLRAREPARRGSKGDLMANGSLQALVATHELFEDAAAQLRVEVEQAVRSRGLFDARGALTATKDSR